VNALERLTAYLCQQPGTGHMDAHHADFARQVLGQHAQELAAAAGESGVIPLADRLRETATTLAARSDVATTDDPLTLMRCLHSTLEALAGIAPAALAAADLDGKTSYTGAGVAGIPGRLNVGLASATNALWDAYNSI
jgi:hypothetical protein